MDQDFDILLEQIKTGRTQPPSPREPTNYEKFLDSLLHGKHPAFCDLIWNGEAYYISLLVHFQKAPETHRTPRPEADFFRRSAWRRFKRVKEDEQSLIHIRVTVKNGLPVVAEITTRPEAAGVFRIGTERLLEFQNP